MVDKWPYVSPMYKIFECLPYLLTNSIFEQTLSRLDVRLRQVTLACSGIFTGSDGLTKDTPLSEVCMSIYSAELILVNDSTDSME